MDGPMEEVIRARELKRVFGKGTTEKIAVDSISFDVKKGEIFGILGPNGAGKTTTIRMLSTLLIPSSGSAEVLGIDVSDDARAKELRKRINMVSGGERGLYYRLTGRQNLKYFSDLYGVPKDIRDRRISEVLELVGMTEAADRRVEEYSRGMKQRIHIARALINDPEILYLDEPTIGLDPEISLQIRRIVRELSDSGKTIILTTHYMYEAEELCDRILILKQGKVVGYGTAEELKSLVSDDTMVRIVTTSDPTVAVDGLDLEPIVDRRVESLSGRFAVSIRCRKDAEIIEILEERLQPFGIRSIGYDEPTLEDTYLYLTGGD